MYIYCCILSYVCFYVRYGKFARRVPKAFGVVVIVFMNVTLLYWLFDKKLINIFVDLNELSTDLSLLV